MCDCFACNGSRKKVNDCFSIYKKYKWLLNTYVLDFYSCNFWSNLPLSWRNFYENLEPNDIATVLDVNSPCSKLSSVYPLSILALKKLLKDITLARNQERYINLNLNVSKHNVITKRNETVDEKFTEELFDHPQVKYLFWKHVKEKKKYEIIIMAQVCATEAKRTNCNIIIDCGSGLGHLSRILTYKYGLEVICLEVQEKLSIEAKKLDVLFEKNACKYIQNQIKNVKRPIHLNVKVDENINLNELIKKTRTSSDENDFKFGVIGLHPCGDLAPVLLKLFKNNEKMKFINLVGCCYMKLTTEGEQFIGYPLSDFLLSRENELTYIAREMSCHANEMFIDRLKAGNYMDLKIHAYRAVLEKIIVKYFPELRHSGLRSVKCTENLTFEQYCMKALQGKNIIIPRNEFISLETEKLLFEWKKVVFFTTIRTLFAPVIETIILLDRFLFVSEKNMECSLLPIFDPCISPRNHILIANKI